MDNTALYLSAVAFAVVFGIVATVIYYFARYYVKMDEDDHEVIPALKKTAKATSLNEALSGTRTGLWNKIRSNSTASDLNLDSLEEALFTSDIGTQTAQKIFSDLSEQMKGSAVTEASVREALRACMLNILTKDSKPKDLWAALVAKPSEPIVWMVVGVNGVGKTTTIGKLASQAKTLGYKVLIVAGDTYRAAADAQLAVWAERSGAVIHSPEGVKDPAAVAYSSLEFAKANKFDLVIVDTAGRLHTQAHLMDELKKVKRVMSKVIANAPLETLLVVDANNGQNAQLQAKNFHEALQLTGVILTKMDGTAKGGVVLGIIDELHLPVPLIGVGEAIEDLRVFSPSEFVESIV